MARTVSFVGLDFAACFQQPDYNLGRLASWVGTRSPHISGKLSSVPSSPQLLAQMLETDLHKAYTALHGHPSCGPFVDR